MAAQSGDKLDANLEFVGQGLANLSAAFCAGYPVSGSLARTGWCDRNRRSSSPSSMGVA